VTAAAIETGPACAWIYALLAEAAAVARCAGALEPNREQAAGGSVLAWQGEAVVHAQNLQVGVRLYRNLLIIIKPVLLTRSIFVRLRTQQKVAAPQTPALAPQH
jgi:hypothetical protein